MTTSGVSLFNPSTYAIIDGAYINIGAIDAGESPTAGMYKDGAFKLNSLIKEWEAKGIHVWTEEEAILFYQKGQNRYLLGGTTDDNCCDANDYVLSQLNTAASAGDTSVTLIDPAIGITDNDYFGIVLDSGFTFWTTVNGAPSGAVVTFDDALPSGASAQNFVFAYTTKIVRPLKIPNARNLTYSGLNENPMSILSRQEYMDLPNKINPGTPTQWYYSPQLVSGIFYPWPNPSTSAWAARFTWYRPLQDVTSPANTADVPQEWANALIWNLAKELAPGYSVPQMRWAMIKEMADAKLELVQGYDRDIEPIYFSLSYDETQR